MGIILVTKEVAGRIHLCHQKSKNLPVVIEIPDKNGPHTIGIDHLLDIAEAHERDKEERIKQLHEGKRSSSQTSHDRTSLYSGGSGTSQEINATCEIHRESELK